MAEKLSECASGVQDSECVSLVQDDARTRDIQDEVFCAEQAHLNRTYAKLCDIRDEAEEALAHLNSDMGEEFAQMKDELFLGSADADQALEMQIEYEYLNHLIDRYNLSYDMNTETLARVLKLLKRPYFAKLQIRFKPQDRPREIYIGEAGMTDEDCRHFIVDWRSPVAEVYYNQDNGRTSYVANGRTITCDLLLRRQFDIEENRLNAYFDTTIAIEDELLLEALMHERSDKMGAITTTIQREQNQVIRHPDVDALLVSGVAGSGKTSVLLQRIAYLFYHNRSNLDPKQVFLITPNPVFRTYIDGVLPDLGESNPQMITYDELAAQIGAWNHAKDDRIDLSSMYELRQAAQDYRFHRNDFCDIVIGDEVVISAVQVARTFARYEKMPRKCGIVELMIEDLTEQLESRIKSRACTEEVQGEALDLSSADKVRIFGQDIFPQTEEDFRRMAQTYLRYKYTGVAERIEAAEWLRVDRIGARLMSMMSAHVQDVQDSASSEQDAPSGGNGLSRAQWAFLKVCLTGLCERKARYVIIDEAQDYTQAQLLMLKAYFPNAHFMMLGDENQALTEHTASFAQIREVFEKECAGVSECRLMTSYRSSPEITELFSGLMDNEAGMEVHSVQRPGVVPVIKAYENEEDYRRALCDSATQSWQKGGLSAVIASDSYKLERVSRILTEAGVDFVAVDGSAALPERGLVLLTVKSAKGLEFDRVIIPDAYAQNYPDTKPARHRLYTALSRATQAVSVFCRGALTPLLSGDAN